MCKTCRLKTKTNFQTYLCKSFNKSIITISINKLFVSFTVFQVKFGTCHAAEILTSQCCEEGCFQRVTIHEVLECRQNKTNKDWVLQQLKTFRNGAENHFVISGKKICVSAWKRLYGISDSMYNDACKLQDQGVLQIIHGNKSAAR